MDKCLLIFGQGIGQITDDTQTIGNRGSGTFTIARQHADFNILSAKYFDGFGGCGFYLIFNGNKGNQLILTTKIDDTIPIRFILGKHIT